MDTVMRFLSLLITLLLSLTFNQAWAQLTPEQQAAKERGLMLYNQYKEAVPDLRIAAEAGDREAQYFLAESLRLEKRYMTAEAHNWYEAAAQQGDYYAMIRLGRSGNDLCTVMNNCPPGRKAPLDWLREALKQAEPQAQQGDAEAMYILYHVTASRDWLEKAANAGHAMAQYWMAIRASQGEGFFFPPGKRQEAVEKWFKASAESGYPVAMMRYVGILYEKNQLAEARYWIERAAKTGYESGVASYGGYLAHNPDLFGFPLDLVKGYALTSLLAELDGGGNVEAYLEQALPEIAAKMTPEQIEQAKVFAQEWKATHPPLSFFPKKLGY
jgi:TPR repeat protein